MGALALAAGSGVMQYTAAVLADLQRRIAGGLARWGLSAQTVVRLLNVSENATYGLRDPVDGRELVLRVHRVGYSSAEEIRSELAWIDALRRERVVDTAAPVRGVDGEYLQRLEGEGCGAGPRWAVAFERVRGREPEAHDAARWFGQLGAATARLHAHAMSWPLPAGFRRKRWDAAATLGERAHWGSWRSAVGLDAAGVAIVERAALLIERRLHQYGVTSGRFGLVHADLRLANLLVDGEALAVIDFDDCGFGWYGYDFATAVSFIEHSPAVPELLEAWVVGYRAAVRRGSVCGGLDAATLAEMPTFVTLRRIALTAWAASHAEVPFARALGADFTRGTVELAERLLGGGMWE